MERGHDVAISAVQGIPHNTRDLSTRDVACEGIGQIIAESVQRFFALDRNGVVVEKLRAAGVNFEGPPAAPVLEGAVSLEGVSVVLTGSLTRSTREEASAALTARTRISVLLMS